MSIDSNASALRVLHIASGDLWAGAEVQLHLLASHLATLRDFEIRVALMNEGELASRLRDSGVVVKVIDEARSSPLAIIAELRRVMDEFAVQVVHTHRLKENLLGLIANLTSVKAASVRTIHGIDEHDVGWRHPSRHIACIANDLTGRYLARRVIAVSSALGATLENEYGYRNVSVVHNGIDLEDVADRQVQAPFVDQRRSCKHVAFVGRLERVKRGDLFLEIAALLEDKRLPYEIRFHLFGDGSQRTMLEAAAVRLKINHRTVFHGHRVEIVSWLASLDALVLCSDNEGLPMILLEALAAGTPVVAHAVGGIIEVMGDGNSGVLVRTHEARAYAEALVETLHEGPPTETENARFERLKSYSAKRTAALTGAVYKSIVDAT